MNTKCSPRELAVALCKNRSTCSVQVAAVLSDEHGVFSWGWNNPGNGDGLCAERHAFRRANRQRLKGATLTIAGMRKKNKKWVFARPCVKRGCWKTVVKNKIRIVEYTNKDGEWIKEKINYEEP